MLSVRCTLDKAIRCMDANNSKVFMSESRANVFAEQLRKQGKKVRITSAADPLNKGSTQWRVEWG